jgi:HsdM N-terminal domain
MPQGKTGDAKKNNGANLGFEEKLWQAADKLRGHMDAAEYKHVVLGLAFLKYISDAFEEHYLGEHSELTMDVLKAYIAGIVNRQVFFDAYPSIFRRCHSLLLYSTPTCLSVCFYESVVPPSLLRVKAEKSRNARQSRRVSPQSISLYSFGTSSQMRLSGSSAFRSSGNRSYCSRSTSTKSPASHKRISKKR